MFVFEPMNKFWDHHLAFYACSAFLFMFANSWKQRCAMDQTFTVDCLRGCLLEHPGQQMNMILQTRVGDWIHNSID